MKALTFFVGAVLSGLGLYFLIPILVLFLPIFGAPLLLLYIVSKWISQPQYDIKLKSGENVEFVKRIFERDFTLELINLSNGEQNQVRSIVSENLYRMKKILPGDIKFKFQVSKRDYLWKIGFTAKSSDRTYYAQTLGFNPLEAFLLIGPNLVYQAKSWRNQRVHPTGEPLLSKNERDQVVLIVDDDVDAAMLASLAFQRLGCRTRIATTVDRAVSELARRDTDVVVLDWDLGNNTFANEVLARATIDSRSGEENLTGKGRKIPKIVTYSSAHEYDLCLPMEFGFCHTEHWQKPMTLPDLELKSRQVIQNNLIAV